MLPLVATVLIALAARNAAKDVPSEDTHIPACPGQQSQSPLTSEQESGIIVQNRNIGEL